MGDRIAVLGASSRYLGYLALWLREGETREPLPPMGAVEYADLAAAEGIRQIWVHASALPLLGGEDWTPAGARVFGKSLAWQTVKVGRASVTVSVPAWMAPAPGRAPLSPWALPDTPTGLYAALAAFTGATGGLWWGSGAATSDWWLRELHRRSPSHIVSASLPEPAQRTKRGLPPAWENPIHWRRVPRGEEAKARYCVHLDKTAQYLGAASSLALPVGEPVYDQGGEWEQPRPPGCWFVRRPPAIPDLPDPFQPDGPRPEYVWVTTPTLTLAKDLGPVEVVEGWYWPEHHKPLGPWYKRIRDGLAQLQRGTPEHRALKEVYQQGWGRWASLRRSDGAESLYQPAWAMHLVAEARVRLFRTLARLDAKPVAVDVDGVWWMTSRAPETFGEELTLRMGTGVGMWRLEGVVAGAEARQILLDGKDAMAAIRGLRAAEKRP